MTTQSVPTAKTVLRKKTADKYMKFLLGCEWYRIPALKVREIIRLSSIPSALYLPKHFKQWINLRGVLFPVIDLRLGFGMEISQAMEAACIIVVRLASVSDSTLQMAFVVDAVEEAVNISQSDIGEIPDFWTAVDTAAVLGVDNIKHAFKTLLAVKSVALDDIPQSPSQTVSTT